MPCQHHLGLHLSAPSELAHVSRRQKNHVIFGSALGLSNIEPAEMGYSGTYLGYNRTGGCWDLLAFIVSRYGFVLLFNITPLPLMFCVLTKPSPHKQGRHIEQTHKEHNRQHINITCPGTPPFTIQQDIQATIQIHDISYIFPIYHL